VCTHSEHQARTKRSCCLCAQVTRLWKHTETNQHAPQFSKGKTEWCANGSTDQCHLRMWHLLWTGQNIGQAPWAFDRMDTCAIKVFSQSINTVFPIYACHLITQVEKTGKRARRAEEGNTKPHHFHYSRCGHCQVQSLRTVCCLGVSASPAGHWETAGSHRCPQTQSHSLWASRTLLGKGGLSLFPIFIIWASFF
jgi:hypothetical protein